MDEVFVISRRIKVRVGVISRSQRLWGWWPWLRPWLLLISQKPNLIIVLLYSKKQKVCKLHMIALINYALWSHMTWLPVTLNYLDMIIVKFAARWCPRLLFQEFTYVYMLWANQKRDGGANQKRDRGFNIHLAGCRIRLKVEVGCGIWDLLKARCGMKVGRQDWDMNHFEGGIGDRMGVGGIMKCIFCELETSLSNACV